VDLRDLVAEEVMEEEEFIGVVGEVIEEEEFIGVAEEEFIGVADGGVGGVDTIIYLSTMDTNILRMLSQSMTPIITLITINISKTFGGFRPS
jgi:hypothetical protein